MNNTDKETLNLLNGIKNGEENSYYKLHKRYLPLLEKMTARFSASMETDEVMQLASIGLFEAAMSYDQSKADRITFGLYADICIKNRIISELRRLKPAFELNDELAYESTDSSSPEDDLIRREDISIKLHMACELLTPYEKKVFDLYTTGKSYSDIANTLNKSVKSVDNALSRIKAKFKNQN